MKSYHMVQYYKHADSIPRVFIAPSKYIQGSGKILIGISKALGVINYLGDYICSISPRKENRSCVILISQGGIHRFGEKSKKQILIVISS